MKTDTEAIATYFESWREGWPVPEACDTDSGEWCWDEITLPCVNASISWTRELAETLTGVLVVELAKRNCLRIDYDDLGVWNIWDDRAEVVLKDASTLLCALVAAWLEVNK